MAEMSKALVLRCAKSHIEDNNIVKFMFKPVEWFVPNEWAISFPSINKIETMHTL
jgi:hypothetical protein